MKAAVGCWLLAIGHYVAVDGTMNHVGAGAPHPPSRTVRGLRYLP